jgi:hypothetical protein
VAQPWSTIAENDETGELSFEMHMPLPSGEELTVIWHGDTVRELLVQLTEFVTLVDQKRAMEEIVAADSGGH